MDLVGRLDNLIAAARRKSRNAKATIDAATFLFMFDKVCDVLSLLGPEFASLVNSLRALLWEKLGADGGAAAPPGKQLARDEVMTDRAKKYFAKAIERGWMERTESGYRWLYGGNRGKVRLAYFLKHIYNPDETGITPFEPLGRLFAVSRLDNSTYKLGEAKKELKWKSMIDKLFDD